MFAQPPMECPPPAAQKHYIENHLKSGEPFKAFVLKSATSGAVIEASGPRDSIVSPLAILYHGRIADFAGRTDEGGKPHVEMLAAERTTVQAYIGNRALAPAQLKSEVVERTIHAAPDLGIGAVGFTDGHEAFGLIP